MSGGPLLSVLVPAWNAATSIERALDSILEARDVALECLVIDDGSTDATSEVVRQVAVRDPRVRLIALPENVGVSVARNRGLEAALGDWLCFLDADDRLLPGAIEALMRPTTDAAVKVVVGQRIWTDGEEVWVSKVYDIPDITQPGRKSIATHPGLLYYASSTGKVIHRSLVTDLRFEGRVLGDQPWTIRAMLRAGSGIEVIGDVVYEWTRPHPDRYVETIGAATRASSARATAMAALVPAVYRAVSDELDDGQAFDDRTRERLKVAYLDRLIRADLAPTVRLALDRRDPDAGPLLRAIGDFLDGVPEPVLAASGPLSTSLLRQPAGRWRSLVPAARRDYWAMVGTALRADRRVSWRIGGPLGAPAFLAFAWFGEPIGSRIASAWLVIVDVLRTTARRVLRTPPPSSRVVSGQR